MLVVFHHFKVNPMPYRQSVKIVLWEGLSGQLLFSLNFKINLNQPVREPVLFLQIARTCSKCNIPFFFCFSTSDIVKGYRTSSTIYLRMHEQN